MADIVTTESGSSVTFENGRAVEQTTSGDAPDGEHGEEIAAAKAAVKKALQEEGRKAAAEAKEHLDKDPMTAKKSSGDKPKETAAEDVRRDESGRFVPKTPKPDETAGGGKKPQVTAETEDDGPALKQALAERKEIAKAKAEAAAELQRARQEARTMYQQLQRERAELQAERDRLGRLKKDPIGAIRENGWEPEQFILDIAQDGTPEGQLRRQQRELQQQLQELAQWKKQMAEAQERQAQEYELRQRKAYRETVEREFLKTALDDSKHPHLTSFYKGDEASLLSQGDLVAERYRQATGEEATFQDIAEYLEERAAKWYRSMSERKSAQTGTQVAAPAGSQPTGIPGKRTLSPSSSGERRSLGSIAKDLDGEERLEAAREAVKAALAATSDET